VRGHRCRRQAAQARCEQTSSTKHADVIDTVQVHSFDSTVTVTRRKAAPSIRRSGRVPPGPVISNALKVRSLLLPGAQDPSSQCLLHYVQPIIIIIMLPNQAIASTPSAPRPSGAEHIMYSPFQANDRLTGQPPKPSTYQSCPGRVCASGWTTLTMVPHHKCLAQTALTTDDSSLLSMMPS
jgi:hypothetical protein